MATGLNRDLILVILQFLNEEKYEEAARCLEKESGLFFNMKHFDVLINGGKWDEVEKYLSGFTKIEDNKYSMKIYFEIRKQKYLEALDRGDKTSALEILNTDLKFFAELNEDLYKDLTQLLTLKNFRENAQLSGYGDLKTARAFMLLEIKKLVEANPRFTREMLVFPEIASRRLTMLLNHSLNWQHSLCPNPVANPEMKTILVDHSCGGPADHINPQLNFSNQHFGTPPRAEGSVPMFMNGAFQPVSVPTQTPMKSWIGSSSGHPVPGLVYGGLNNAVLRGPGDSNGMLPQPRPPAMRTVPGSVQGPNQGLGFGLANDFPTMVVRTLNLSSAAATMDFHPIQQTMLLVGMDSGEINLWEVSSKEKILSRSFQLRDIGSCSMTLKAALTKDPSVTVRRVSWSADGLVFGVAYSKHLVHLYLYCGITDIRLHLEIDAHIGSVNDIAFSKPSEKPYLITCGDDKLIKVWDVPTGLLVHRFEGHEAAVHSVHPHYKENVHFIFSTSVEGNMKAWLYDTVGSRVDYFTPNHACSTMAYSADGTRLFSCGTTREGETSMVEWNENEGSIKRTYQGFEKRSLGFVQFDTAKNRYLAAGHDFLVKFWDMNNVAPIATTNADGGLMATPRVRFSKDGSLLAVSASENKIKILANGDGLLLMRVREKQVVSASDTPIKKNGGSMEVNDVKGKGNEESNAKNAWKVTEISTPAQFRSLRVPVHVKPEKVFRLLYNNAGTSILALASNGIILLWKWPRKDPNTRGSVTTADAPQQMQTPIGKLLTNDLTNSNPDEVVHCLAMSKNDSYAVSAAGGKISLLNMMTFKNMTSFMAPPPSATSLAFHPQDNNVIAIGMADSTIHIYNARLDGVKHKLNGHTKRITGLAFSHLLTSLVSAGADSQIIIWDSDKWERRSSYFLFPTGKRGAASDTHIQFHQDQTRLLVVNQTQISVSDIRKPESAKQWVVAENASAISHAAFSCDGKLIFSGFMDGAICVFAAAQLQILCQIKPSAYLQPGISGSNVYPLVVAAHPQEPNQFAMGLNDGNVVILEPLESEGKWGVVPPFVLENGATTSTVPLTPRVSGSEKMQG